jgi:hypothetical protein
MKFWLFAFIVMGGMISPALFFEVGQSLFDTLWLIVNHV